MEKPTLFTVPQDRKTRVLPLERNYRDLNILLGDKPHRVIVLEPYMRLVVERVGDGEVSLCHYGEQNGDAMRDPEVVFEVTQLRGSFQADPIYYRNDYLGLEQFVKFERDGKSYTRPGLQADLRRFVRSWFTNLRQQGFFDVR
jgi:hypothetical protein